MHSFKHVRVLLLCVLCVASAFLWQSTHAQEITAKEKYFLKCVRKPEMDCYSECYHFDLVYPDPYDESEYADGVMEFANDPMLRGLMGYHMHDWRGNPLFDPTRKHGIFSTTLPGENNDQIPSLSTGNYEARKQWWKNVFKTGFIFMHTNKGLAVSNPDQHNNPELKAKAPHAIRVTLRVGNVPNRARILWKIVNDLCKTFAPQWLKVDTPGHERMDSVIMQFTASEHKSRGQLRRSASGHMLPAHVQLRQKYENILDYINNQAEIEVDGEMVKMADFLEGGERLPVFQYQKDGNALASVADYYYGASFGDTLCTHVTGSWRGLNSRLELVEKSIKYGANEGIVKLWRTNGHPITTEWSFRDPSDNNFSEIVSENRAGSKKSSIQVQKVGTSETAERLENKKKKQQRLLEEVTQLERQAERLENNVH